MIGKNFKNIQAGATIIADPRVRIIANDGESNNSDQTKRTNTPGKDNEKKRRNKCSESKK